ncbi:sigma factor-like helix-turn-helix DNA-binding protein [Pseudoramibacter sp. HA2172]|uniref:sigma factor-like helix-turn-helix DNA-binding protein n=1 Tax=Pseudoramibacter faecis TaxID=3108534 RepID=UPI002E7AAE4C|nr:sigma factor-like helix-turn-helix DNA-binding protein [Pseudoramibacter sp. HA2172]
MQNRNEKVREKIEEQFLFDFYGELLSERLKLVLSYYYNEDCSVSEIAELTQMTRQGASDALRRGRRQLKAYEEKLGLVTRFRNNRKLISGTAEEMAGVMDDPQIRENAKLRQTLADIANKIRQFADTF